MKAATLSPGDRGAVLHLASLSVANLCLAAELDKDYTRTWVVRDPSGSAIAYLLAWHVADELQIVDITTAPHARRRGAANALLQAAKQHAIAHACRLLVLEVRENNVAARALYSAFGFQLARTRTDYYARGVDGLEMELVI